ncbi:hypothetical protein KIL84_014316 [Mauremys mutica]|uniref:Uncharacterized protein n=1 Tax=Mauremys mutica TaxID=74926 RepID=A0A9D3XR46_9SAUR|nr:hypothetical protein KIL84_014316 [Mauremys mutica]
MEKALHQRQFRGGGGSDRGYAVNGYAGTQTQTRNPTACETPPRKRKSFLEALDSIASSSKDELGPPCFCSTPIQIVEEDSEDDSYVFNRRRGMELSEPVLRCERKKVMWTIVQAAVYALLKHCHREKLFEDCEGCVIDAPAQWHHDGVTWTSVDINCKLWGLCAELCLESLLNTVIAIGYAMQCLCLTQEHLAQGVTLLNAVQFSGDTDGVLKKMTKLEDGCLQRYIDSLVCTKSYRTLLKKKTICKKSKKINLENAIPTKTNTASVTAKQLFTHTWDGRYSIVNRASPSVCQVEILNGKNEKHWWKWFHSSQLKDWKDKPPDPQDCLLYPVGHPSWPARRNSFEPLENTHRVGWSVPTPTSRQEKARKVLHPAILVPDSPSR